MNILENTICELQENINEIPNEILDNYCIISIYFHQYAAGVTGSEYNCHLYVSDKFGYRTKREAYKVAADNNLLPFSKRGQDTPYGEIGAKQRSRIIKTIREIIENPIVGFHKFYKFELL